MPVCGLPRQMEETHCIECFCKRSVSAKRRRHIALNVSASKPYPPKGGEVLY
jgi:hypothetical protein